MQQSINGVIIIIIHNVSLIIYRLIKRPRQTCVCCSWAKSLEQSTSNGAICTITVYIHVSFEDISFSLRFQY